MGNVTRILVTGASGFIGRAVVAEARSRGLTVVAATRRNTAGLWDDDPGVETLVADLTDSSSVRALRKALDGSRAVIHAAAHLGGDAQAVEADTVLGTATLLEAMEGTDATMVLVSSIVVYDTMRLSPGDTLDESAPLEPPLTPRDAYTRGKLQQESLTGASGRAAWLMRSGAVYGPGRTWHALLGFWVWKLFVRIDGGGELPLVHVDHLARALVDAALTPPQGLQALNVVDDDLPTRARFVSAHRRVAGWPRAVLPVPFRVWIGMARLLRPVAARLPGLFREPVLRARLMPLHYPNAALRKALGGRDDAPFEKMLERSIGGA